METQAQRETRITRYVCIAIVALYIMAAYKDIKKGFVEGYNSFNTTSHIYKAQNNSNTEEVFLLNRYML